MSISCCRKMDERRFSLNGNMAEAFVPGPQAETLWLDYEGRVPEKAIAKNVLVYPGMLLARHPDAGVGDLHCPVVGVVSDAAAQGVMISVGLPAPKPTKKTEDADAPAEEAKAPEVPVTHPVNLDGLSGADLAKALKELGIHTGLLMQPCKTLVINALNPDPGVTWAEPMLGVHIDVIKAGLDVLRRLTPATSIVFACAEGDNSRLASIIDVRLVKAVYPASLDPLVIKAATGKECPDDAAALSLHELWKLGRVARTGLPLTETVLTLGGVNYIVPLGTPARVLLDHAKMAIGEGDVLVFGGPLRGVAQSRVQVGVSSRTYNICVVRHNEVPRLEGDAACVACGECVQICPARLQPDLLSRFAEFGQDEKCRTLHINACMDCGLCTYACIARRPVLQYLRLARQRLAQGGVTA